MFRSTSSAIRFIRARGFAHTPVARDAAPELPYFIHRNSRGSIPVYTDIRNAGTRYLVQIRNVEGNVNVRPPSSSFVDLHVFVMGTTACCVLLRVSCDYRSCLSVLVILTLTPFLHAT